MNARLPKYSETRTLPKFLRRGLTQKLSLAESERAVLCNGREKERVRGQLAESGKTLLLVKRGSLFCTCVDKIFINNYLRVLV